MNVINLLLMGIMIGAVTYTISSTAIFEWLRELVSKIHPKFEELIHCPICLSFWASLVLLLTSDVQLLTISKFYWYNLAATIFLIMGIASLFHFVMLRAYQPVIEKMVQRKINELRKKANKQILNK